MSTPPIVIIVEPATMISDVLRVEFSCLGFAVLLASSGEEAETFAAHANASLLVFDVTVRKMNLYGACARIRRQNDYAKRPIVLTADRITDQDAEAARVAGATVLLAKPYSMTDLVQAVTPHLPPGDPLLQHPSQGPGMGEATREWIPSRTLTWRFGADSGLSRNGSILNVVRTTGKKIPLVRVT